MIVLDEQIGAEMPRVGDMGCAAWAKDRVRDYVGPKLDFGHLGRK